MSNNKKQNLKRAVKQPDSSDDESSEYETINSSDESTDYSTDESGAEEPSPPPRRRDGADKNKKPIAPPLPQKKGDKKGAKKDDKKRGESKKLLRKKGAASDSDDSDDSDYNTDDAETPRGGGANEPVYSIIIAPNGNAALSQEYMDYFGGGGDSDELENNENSNEEYTSEDERNFMKENYEKIPEPESICAATAEKAAAKAARVAAAAAAKEKPLLATDVYDEYCELLKLKKELTERLDKSPKNQVLQNAIKDCKRSIKKLVKTARNDNTNRYIKLVQKGNGGESEKNGEVDFFKKKMSNREQLKIMDELAAINNHIFVEKPYRLALLETPIPAKFKAIALQKLNMLKGMEPGDSEYYKIKNWVDTFMRIPF
jgi:hypothetical protein